MNHIRQKIFFLKIIDKFADITVIISSFYLSIILESLYHKNAILPFNNDSFNTSALIISIPIFVLSITYIERHFFYRLSRYIDLTKNVSLICIISFLSIIAINFLLKMDLFYRSTIIFFIISTFTFLLFKRILIKLFLESIRFEGMDYKNIMILGYGNRSKQLIDFLIKHKEYGMKISCIIDKNLKAVKVDTYSGGFNKIEECIPNLNIDDVFICMDTNNIPESEKIFDLFYSYGVNVHIMTDRVVDKYIKKYNANPIVENFSGIPSFTYNVVQVSYYKLVLKNLIERIFAFIIIILSMPIVLISMLIISITSKGWPIFIQERVGLRGRIFNQYKLRTMVLNAESFKKDLLAMNELDGPIFKIKDDPRITWFGKFLRKFSIDELPQFINVIKGDMNVVGPRPYPIYEVNNFEEIKYYRRHSMKPGITGLWQIKDRNNIKSFKDCIKFDLDYIDNWSFMFDFYIVFMTIPTILKGKGK